ncbi:MAG: putative lipid II flippase FtsW [Gammaproteobacteria bacterium]
MVERQLSSPGRHAVQRLDGALLTVTFLLLGFGLVMVASASVFWSTAVTGHAWRVFDRQLLFALLGLAAGFVVLNVPLSLLLRFRLWALALALLLLALVLVPGIGREVNGSIRWLPLGPIRIQASEPALLLLAIYLAGYASEQGGALRENLAGLVRPLFVVGCCAMLLLLEPDFGAAVVLIAMAGTVFFLAGARWRDLFRVFWVAVFGLLLIALAAPYRVIRLTTFLDPWHHALGGGFQLAQSLMAIGHGGWWGVGLGRGIEKMFYLPEPESDFIFAVIGEELGFVGMMVTLALYGYLLLRIFRIGRKADVMGRRFEGFLCYAIGGWIGMEALINMGVNLGALPTKGITLPLLSAGGSNLVVTLVAIGLVLNVDASLGGRRIRSNPAGRGYA